MSVERVERKDGGVVWRVRWRQGGRNRSKVLGRKRDAEAFDAELVRRKRTGELARLDAGKESSPSSARSGGGCTPSRTSRASTLKVYAVQWDAHVLPRLGHDAAARVDAGCDQPLPAGARGRRRRAGVDSQGAHPAPGRPPARLRVGPHLACNPVLPVRKPPVGRARAVVPLAPETVEAIRDHLLRARLVRDATLVSVLAYAGLRPGRGTRAHVGARARPHAARRECSVVRRDRGHEDRPAPDGAAPWPARAGPRGVAPARRATRARRGSCSPATTADRGRSTAYQNWRRRIYAPAATAAGIERPRPYDLRHSFVSLLIAEGHNVVEVARQAGHSPKMALDTYAHVFEEFDPAERVNAADRIRKAREELRFRAQQPTLFDVA